MPVLPNNRSRAVALQGVGYNSRVLAFLGWGGLSVQVSVVTRPAQKLVKGQIIELEEQRIVILVRYKKKQWQFARTIPIRFGTILTTAKFLQKSIVESTLNIFARFKGKKKHQIIVEATLRNDDIIDKS